MKVKTDIIIHISAMPTGSVVKKIDNVQVTSPTGSLLDL
jgi:hypothetical protein